MLTDIRQNELDLAEERVLTNLFGSTTPDAKTQWLLKFLDIDINDIIQNFESIMKPIMDDNGLVNAEYMDWCLAEEAVEDMLHDNGKTGERFSKDTTNSHAKRFGFHEDEEADFYFVMNMMYSDYCLIVGEDENRYAEFAKKFIKDKDGPKGKAKKYYYAMM